MKANWMSAVAFALLGACGAADDGSMSPLPEMPMLAPGMAMVSGRVLTPAQQPVAGATVSLASVTLSQGNATATTDAQGNFSLTVPGDTTLNLRAEATGYTRALGNSILVAAGGMSTGFELIMVPTATMDSLSAMGGARAAEYGALAVEVVSKSGACNPAGGKVSIEPSGFGKVFYGKAADGMPDTALTAVAAGARPAAWILGVLPPAIYYRLKFEKAGCTPMAMPLDWAGRNYDGRVQVEAKAVSRALLFVQ